MVRSEPSAILKQGDRFAWASFGVVVATGLNLRPALSGVAPVLPEIMRDTGLGVAGASMLGALPVLCLGVFALLAPPLSRRLGLERAILAVLAMLTLGLALRAWPAIPALFAGSVLAGAAIGAANVLLPALLKRDFPSRPGLMAGVYVTSVCLGAAIGAGIAVPLEQMSGFWSASLGAWALPAAGAFALAFRAWRGGSGPAGEPPVSSRSEKVILLREALAWQVTLYMGLQSLLAYAFFSWMAPMLRSRGDDARTAGLVVAVSVMVQVAAALPAPLLAARLRRQSVPAAAAVLLIAACYVGLAAAPLGWQWALAVGLGLGSGAALALAITMILLRSGSGAIAARLSAMSQSIGYSLAALGPLLVGVLHQRTGDWRGAEAVFILGGAAAAVAGVLAGRRRVLGQARRSGIASPPFAGVGRRSA